MGSEGKIYPVFFLLYDIVPGNAREGDNYSLMVAMRFIRLLSIWENLRKKNNEDDSKHMAYFIPYTSTVVIYECIGT